MYCAHYDHFQCHPFEWLLKNVLRNRVHKALWHPVRCSNVLPKIYKIMNNKKIQDKY